MEFSNLRGKVIRHIELITDTDDDVVEIIFKTDEEGSYRLFHDQDCCETVYLQDISGKLSDLIGSPILIAEEISSSSRSESIYDTQDGSRTWTFYKLATTKGYVTLKWLGVSNGFYSESVEFEKAEEAERYSEIEKGN